MESIYAKRMRKQRRHAGLHLPVPLQAQPTDSTCGPTCLQAVYAFHGDRVPLRRIIREVRTVEGGGTLGVLLGLHALARGYRVQLYTLNLKIFDPSWFHPRRRDLADRLRREIRCRKGKRREATQAFLQFVEQGGEVCFEDLTGGLIRRHLVEGLPILTGLSATFLYRAARELPDTGEEDDVRGEPLGHFVVLTGYRKPRHKVLVADPYRENPLAVGHEYEVSMDRLINAILLGVLTYDANLLIIRPR
jgi:hypothetical protein